MENIRFLKDFGNIRDWVQEEHHNCQDGTDQTDAYVAALEPIEKLNEELFYFFWDADTYTYRYPTKEEIENDSKKKDLYERLDEYYQDIVTAADTYFNYVNKWNQENQKKREIWEKWKKESKQEKKTEEPEKPGDDIKIPAQYYTLYNYAKRGLWERQDAMKEEHPLAAKSELLANLRKAPDSPVNMEELTAMDEQLSNLVQEEKQIEDEEKTLDEPPAESKKEVLEGEEDYLKTLTKEEKEELEKEEKEKLAKQEEEKKLSDAAKQKEEELARAETEKKAQQDEAEQKAREEEARKDREAIREQSEKAQKDLESDVEVLMKQMQEANKGLFHINSKEFKGMRDSLYALANFTKEIRAKNKNGENTTLDQKIREELQDKIKNLEDATERYISEKGMGQQKTTRGKKRINLAYGIGNFLMKVKENSRERYRMLEAKEIKRLEWEEKNYDKVQAMKAENAKIEEFKQISPLYGRSLYEFSKLEGLENLPEETFYQKKLKNDYQKLQELMRNSADIRLVNAARDSLRTTRFVVMREEKFEELSEEMRNSITKMQLNTPKWERAEKGDLKKYQNDPEFFKERLREYQPILERLGEAENAPYEVKLFVQEYMGLINETDPEKLKPEYFQFQLSSLRDSLYSVPDLVKKKDISLPEKENQEKISNKDLFNLLNFTLVKDIEVMREQFLGFPRKQMVDALSPEFFVADLNRKYGNFLDQLCEQSPEVKEAREWLNEEMDSPDTNANKIAGFMNRKLYKALTSENIKKYEISLEGVESEDVSRVIGKIRSNISKNSDYLLTSYSVGGRAVKKREDRKIIEQQVENVKKAYGEENHATAFYEKLSKAILEMNDGSGAYTSVLNRQAQLHEYLVKGLDIHRKDIVKALSNMQESLENLAESKEVKDPERIREVLLNITKECKEEKEFSQKEQERIAEEKRIAREREIEENRHNAYEYRELRGFVKENFRQLKEQGIFKDYEKEANVFEKSLLEFKDDREILLPMFKQFNMALGALAHSQLETASKDILMKLSGQLEKEIQGIQSHKVEEAWKIYFSKNQESLDEYSNKASMGEKAMKEKRYDYAHRLIALDVLGIDRSFLYDEEDTRLKASRMNESSLKSKVTKRLKDNKEIAFELKSVDKLLKNEKITSEDLVHDKVLLEMAKLSDKILKKINKYDRYDKEHFIEDGAEGIFDMLDSYEKFLKEKYQNKELSFYKENPAAILNQEDASKDLDKENPTSQLYKEWKELQLVRRMEMKHQGIMMGRDQVKAAGAMRKAEEGRKIKDYMYSDEESKVVARKYQMADKLKLPMDAFQSLKTEIAYVNHEKGQYDKAQKMYEEMGRDRNVDRSKLMQFWDYFVDFQTKANVAAYYLMKEAKSKQIPTLKDVGDFLHSSNHLIGGSSEVAEKYDYVLKYSQYQKAFVKEERKEDIFYNANYNCHGIQHFKKPIDADKYAYSRLLNAVMDQEDLTDSFAIRLEETISRDKSASRVIKMPEDVKAILKVVKSVKEGRISNLKFMDAVYDRNVAAKEDCRDAYRNITKAQLGMEIMKQLNDMTVEKRKEYLNNGGAEKILKRFEKLEQFLDSKMPDFLKAEDGKVQDKSIMQKTLLLLQEDRLKEFAAQEKEMEEAQKTDTVKEEKETEETVEL